MAHGFLSWSGPIVPLAGPAATIVASVAATTVTAIFGYFQYHLGNDQKQIALSQRDIAHEKLKADLFDRRFKVCVAARSTCLHIGRSKRGQIDFEKVRSDSAELEDSVFLFGEKTSRYLLELREQMMTCAGDDLTMSALDPSSGEYLNSLSERTKNVRNIMKAYDEIPRILKAEMGLSLPT